MTRHLTLAHLASVFLVIVMCGHTFGVAKMCSSLTVSSSYLRFFTSHHFDSGVFPTFSVIWMFLEGMCPAHVFFEQLLQNLFCFLKIQLCIRGLYWIAGRNDFLSS